MKACRAAAHSRRRDGSELMDFSPYGFLLPGFERPFARRHLIGVATLFQH
jgi:hypothetical protein